MKNILYIGGIYHVGFAVFHLYFWKLFDWAEDLRQLSFVNRNVIQILNLRLIYVFLAFAFLSFFFAEDLLSSRLGRAILISVSVFWLMRAIEQIIFFSLKNSASLILLLIFLFGAAIYIYPVLF